MAACGSNARPTTRDVVINFMRLRLREEGYDGSRAQIVRSLQSRFGEEDIPAVRQIRDFGTFMQSESEHRRFMESAASDIPTCPSFQGQQVYNQVLDAMFTDRRINYGRLSVVVIFTAELAVMAMRRCNPNRVIELVDWCTEYFRNHYFDEWVLAKGGWERMPGSFQQNRGLGRYCPMIGEMQEDMLPHIIIAIGVIASTLAIGYNILHQ